MKHPKTVYILNKTNEEFRDRFDGEDYVFPPNEYVQVPIEAAKLIFGFGEEDKLRAIRRLGWAVTTTELEKAKARLKGFQFHLEPPHYGHQPAPVGASNPPSGVVSDSGGDNPEGGGDTGTGDADTAVPTSNGTPKNLINKLAAAASRG